VARPHLRRLAPAPRPGGGALGLHPQGQRAELGGWYLGVMSQPQIRGSCLSLCSGRRWLERRACAKGRHISTRAPGASQARRKNLLTRQHAGRPRPTAHISTCCPADIARCQGVRATRLRSCFGRGPLSPCPVSFPLLLCLACSVLPCPAALCRPAPHPPRRSPPLALAAAPPDTAPRCPAWPFPPCLCLSSVVLHGVPSVCRALPSREAAAMWFCLPRPAWHGLPLLGQRRLAWPRLLLLLSAVVCWPWLSLAGLGVAVVHLLEQFFSGFCRGFRGCCGDLRYLLRSRGARGIRWAEVGTGTRGHTRPLLPIRRRSAQSARNESKQTKTRLSARRHAHACAKATAQRTSFRLILQQRLVKTGAGRGVRAASVWAQAAAAAKTAGARTSQLGHARSEWMRGMMMTLGRNILQPGQGVPRDMAKYLGLPRCSPRPVREPKLQRPQR
jgi:hypothetical protein